MPILLLPLVYAVLLVVAVPLSAASLEITPFYTFNENPLIQIYGLPPPDNPLLTTKGIFGTALVVDVASHFGGDVNVREEIVLDGESYRTTLGLRYGVADRLEMGVDIPYICYTGGFMDSAVIGFHDAFGFAQSGRDEVPRNRLLLEYSRDGVQRFRVDRANSGIGDIRLLGGAQLYRGSTAHPAALALRMSLKLPTGDSSLLHGSGGTDFALWISGSDQFVSRWGEFGMFGAAGGLAMARGDILPQQRRQVVAFGSAGIGWSPVAWLSLKTQANAHTSFYRDSQLTEVNSKSIQLMVGVGFRLPGNIVMDLGAVDELFYRSAAPDILFNLALRKEFQ